MKRTAIIQATALFLLLGIGFPAGARQGKPEQQEEKPKPATSRVFDADIRSTMSRQGQVLVGHKAKQLSNTCNCA